MEIHSEYPEYRAELNKCNKVFGGLSWLYIVIAVAFLLSVIPMFFLSMSLRADFGKFVCCAVFCIPISLVLGWYAIYKKYPKAAVLGILPATVGVFFVSDAMFTGIIDVALIAISILNAALVNHFSKKYHFLEEQEGFPHFSDLHTDNLKKADIARNSDPYARNEEYYASENVRGKMDELPDVNEKLNAKEDIKHDYMDSI